MCDSVVTTTLTINYTQVFAKTDSICSGDSILLGGAFQNTANVYYDTLTNASANGCDSVVVSTLVIKALPSVVANATSDTLCLSDSTTLFGSGTAVSYSWNNGITDNVSFIPALGTLTYTVIGTAANTCIAKDSISVTVFPDATKPTVTQNFYSYCDEDAIEDIVISGLSGIVTWYNNSALNTPIATGTPFTPNNSLGISTYYVTEVLGTCESDAELISVSINPLPTVDAGTGGTIDANGNLQLQATETGATTIQWTPTEFVSDDAVLNPIVNAKEPTYFVITVTSDSGCIASDSVYLDLNQIISNFLSPNNDNQNDTWEVRPLSSISNCTVMIFDGFGSVVFETNSYQNDWAGEKDGNQMPEGVYYYLIDCGGNKQTGSITLIR